jgi:hypothetical protein
MSLSITIKCYSAFVSNLILFYFSLSVTERLGEAYHYINFLFATLILAPSDI